LNNNTLYPLLVNEIKVRLLDEGIFRLRQCTKDLSLSAINHQWNGNTLSVAQSIIHLNGNVRQWLFEHLLGQANTRQRSKEFSHSANTKEELLAVLNRLEKDINASLPLLLKLDPYKNINIQGIENTTVSAIVHVIEHFSYHTGQVALLTKLAVNKDLGFYSDFKDLE
tara:strand:+ start:9650 stop:10153 length:504 start_codon:yes stop_codon:yes gene_type:complete